MKKGRTTVLVSPLRAHLGYWLRFVSNQVSFAFARKLAARGIAVAEWVLLRAMYDQGPVRPSVLAAQLGMTRGAISKLAERLIRKSLITRSLNLKDRRHQALALTAKGRAVVPELCALADQNDEEFFGHLKTAERERIKAMMEKIVRRHHFRSVPVT